MLNETNTIDNDMIETFCRMIDVIDETKNDDFRDSMFDVSTSTKHVDVEIENVEINEYCDMLISTF